jgi:hypothetical protein
MAVNLNPGADATLVQAATNAAMANVPKDLSQMFQAQTENYRKTMESVGKSYGSAIETVGKVAGEAVKEAIHINEQLIRAGNTESEDTKEFFTNELLALKEEKKALRGMQVFSKERIAARLKMEKRRTDLFAMVDLHESKIDNNIDIVAMENFNPSVTGLNNLTIARSINMKGRPIEEGKQKGIYSRILRRDDGKVGWQTYDSNDRAISSINKDGSIVYADGDNKASFIQDKDLSGLLKQKDDKAQAAAQAIDLRATKNGANGHDMINSNISITRQYSDVITEENIGQLLDRGVGDNISFNEALNTEFTSLSMEAYAGIEKVAGIHDTDGVQGITKADFDVTDKNAVNYALNLENHETLRNAMDPNSKTFNYEATKKALASHNASLSIAKNQTSLEEYNAKQVNANTLATTKQRGATLTNQIRQEQLNKLQNPVNTVTPPTNRTESFQLFTGLDDDGKRKFANQKTSTNELVSLDNQLSELQSLNKSSFDDEGYVDLFGEKVGYFPGKGFAPIKIGEDGQLTREQLSNTKMPKGGYWKTPRDVFKHYSIPNFNQKDYDVMKNGKKYKKVDGGYIEIK